jgi:plasmid stabilization system protein ParE
VRSRYTIKPRADSDIENYADYLARKASLDVALRFLAAADETFSLLAAQPNMG